MYLVPNVLATIVGGVIYWVIGAIWYAGLFGKSYQLALGFSEEESQKAKKGFAAALIVFLICGIVSAYVIGRIVKVANVITFGEGLLVGLWVWVGFVLTLLINLLLFERRPKKLFWINTIFYLIAFAVVGGVMGIWQ